MGGEFFLALRIICFTINPSRENKTKDKKMANKNKFWDENKIVLIPLLWGIALCGVMAGAYFGIEKHNWKKYERKCMEEKAKAVADTLNQAKDTIALSVVNQKQK